MTDTPSKGEVHIRSYRGYSPAVRTRAQAWLRQRWESGELPRPSRCCACGQTEGTIDAHAEDYSEPFTLAKLDACHLCYRCHMMTHLRFSYPDAWTRYRTAVREGIRFAPIHGRDFGQVLRQVYGAAVPFTQYDPPPRSPLDEI